MQESAKLTFIRSASKFSFPLSTNLRGSSSAEISGRLSRCCACFWLPPLPSLLVGICDCLLLPAWLFCLASPDCCGLGMGAEAIVTAAWGLKLPKGFMILGNTVLSPACMPCPTPAGIQTMQS